MEVRAKLYRRQQRTLSWKEAGVATRASMTAQPANRLHTASPFVLDDFLDTPVVRCEDGEITVYPLLRVVEIDGELLNVLDVLELVGALAAAVDTPAPSSPAMCMQTRAGWLIQVVDEAVVVNGFPYDADEIRRHLRSLQYATRLLDI